MAHYEPSHLDLQCLQIQLLLCMAFYRFKNVSAKQGATTCSTFLIEFGSVKEFYIEKRVNPIPVARFTFFD